MNTGSDSSPEISEGDKSNGPDALVLYGGPSSTCSQKVRLVLAEKGLHFEERRMNLGANEHLADWYLRLNPNGVVPTLVHGDAVVTDSSVINEYLEEVFPEVALMPSDAPTRAKMRAWRQFIDEVPTTAIRVPSFNAYILRMWEAIPADDFEALVEKRSVRKHLYRKMGRKGFAQGDVDESLEKLRQTLERMSASLAHGPWLIGSQFTLADVSLIPTLVRMEHLGLARMWGDLPRVADWTSRVRARPSFSAAFYAGSLPTLPDTEPAIC